MIVTLKEYRDTYRDQGYVIVRIKNDGTCVIRKSVREKMNKVPMTNSMRRELYRHLTNPDNDDFDPNFMREGYIHENLDVNEMQEYGLDPRTKKVVNREPL